MPPNAVSSPANDMAVNSEAGPVLSNSKAGASKQTGVLFEDDAETNDGALDVNVIELKKAEKRKLKWVWRNIILFVYLHMAALYGGYLLLTQAKWQTIVFCKLHRDAPPSVLDFINFSLFSHFPVRCGHVGHHGRRSSSLGASCLQG